MMKKIISISLIMAIMFTLFAFTPVVNAEDLTSADGVWTYSLSGDTPPKATVTGYNGTDTDVVIPDTIDDYVVYVISSAFQANANITSVSIPESVTVINNKAFYNCTSLETVTFRGESQLQTLGSSNQGNVFDGCSKLKNIVLPEGLLQINSAMFKNCASLETMVIPSSVTSCSTGTIFYGCTNLKSVTFPACVTSVDKNAFTNCSSLESVTFTSAAAPTIESSSNISKFDITVNYPADGTGYDATWQANFSSSTTFVASGSGAEPTTAPEPTAVPEATATPEVTEEPVATDTPGASHAWTITDAGVITAYTGVEVENLTVPSVVNGITVTAIGNGSVLCDSSTAATVTGTLTIPEGVTEIKNAAFAYFGISAVELPSTVEVIGQHTFRNTKITEIVFPENVTKVGPRAFRAVTTINKVTFTGATAPELTASSTKSPFEAISSCTVYYPASGTGYDETWKASFLGDVDASKVTFVAVGEAGPTAAPAVEEAALSSSNLTTETVAEKSFTAFAKIVNVAVADAASFGIKFVGSDSEVTLEMAKNGEDYVALGALDNGDFSVRLVNGEGKDYLDAVHMGFVPYVVVGDTTYYGSLVTIK